MCSRWTITVKVPQETRWQFEVYALNGVCTEVVATPRLSRMPTGNGAARREDHGYKTTARDANMPRDLTAELARDTNLMERAGNPRRLAVEPPAYEIPGAPVNAYKVELGARTLAASPGTTSDDFLQHPRTVPTDNDEPDGRRRVRAYRIRPLTQRAGAGHGPMATAMIPVTRRCTRRTPPAAPTPRDGSEPSITDRWR